MGGRAQHPLLICASALLASLGFAAPASAQSDIYRCVDEQGHDLFFGDAQARKTYQSQRRNSTCARLDVGAQPVLTVPAPKSSRAATSAGGEMRASPANFPRVEEQTQRSRDSDRRRVLEDELKNEESRLARLRGDFNGGQPAPLSDETRDAPRYQERVVRMQEEIQRSENNVASLRRELALTRY